MTLYRDIEAKMLERISAGDGPPGTRLANEFVLAEEFGVSQGTVRKALSMLLARGLVHRRPRYGTVVAEQTNESALFSFFRMRETEGTVLIPEPGTELVVERAAETAEAEVLGVKRVWEITRVRLHKDVPFSQERVILPADLCPGLDDHAPFPNSLYPFLEQTYRITIDRIEENLSAVAAQRQTAKDLSVDEGTPLLPTLRRSYDLTGRCVEVRDSLYLTSERHYSVTLGR